MSGTGTAAPPQIGLAYGVGTGKTHAIIYRIQDVLKMEPGARVFFSVPDHNLASEAATRMQGELGRGVPVVIWRGLERHDATAPAGGDVRMCPRYADVRALVSAGGELADMCGSAKRGYCPHHPNAGGTCGYILQGLEAAAASVVIITHAMLSGAAPRPLRRTAPGPSGRPQGIAAADLLVIDEGFAFAMLAEHSPRPLVDLDPSTVPAIPHRPADQTQNFADKCTRRAIDNVHGLLRAAQTGERIDAIKLDAAGLTVGVCIDARNFVLRLKVPVPDKALPGAALGTMAQFIGAIASDNARVLWLADFFRVARDVLLGRLGSAAIRAFGETTARTIKLRWREPIHEDWSLARFGIIHADATMNDDIARVWLPGLHSVRNRTAISPHMHVTQITDRAFGYSSVIESGRFPSKDNGKAASKNALRVICLIETLAAQYAGKGAALGRDVLVVLPLTLEKTIADKLPPNVGTLHFGKLRGQDAFKGVAALVVVSRPQPPPEAVEDTAEIIFGTNVSRLPAGQPYPKRKGVRLLSDGTALTAQVDHHPDLHAEAVRTQATEAELIQAIGRGRGIRRTAADPLAIYLLTNVPLEAVPVNAAVLLDDLWREFAGTDPVRELERAGVLPTDWPGVGAVLANMGFFPRAKDPAGAARDCIRRNPGYCRRLADFTAKVTEVVGNANPGHFPYNIPSMGNARYSQTGHPSPQPSPQVLTAVNSARSVPWHPYRYRRLSARKSGVVWVSPDHAWPRTAVEALIGAVSLFEPLPTSAFLPAPAIPFTVVGESKGGTSLSAPIQHAAAPAAVVFGLPHVMNELSAAGALTLNARRRHMDRFRLDRGTLAERERAALGRLAREIGPSTVAWAGEAASARRLGNTPPMFKPTPTAVRTA